MTQLQQGWQKWVQEARERRDAELPAKWRVPVDKLPGVEVKNVMDFPRKSGLLTTLELQITDSNVPQLLKKIRDKEWTAQQVTEAFSHRAAIAQQVTNCLSCMFFERGIKRAKQLDEYYEREGKLMGPLHGIPVSLKDCQYVKGTYTGIGIASYSVDKKATENSLLANLLLSMGAVLYCKTTVPTAMMWGETDTRVMGRTVSPHNRDTICGGSSGGEGVLAAMRGAPVGIGSDIAGSIRIPSNHNAIYGLKGTSGRISNAGCRSVSEGQPFYASITGPMSNDIESLEYITKLLLNAGLDQLDNDCIPLAWRDPEPELSGKRLAFGILWDDRVVRPTSAITRALQMAVDALKGQGHEVIDWSPVRAEEMNDYQELFFSADGSIDLKKALQGEPLLPAQEKNREITWKDAVSSRTFTAQNERIKIAAENFNQWRATAAKTSSGRPIDALISPCAVSGGIPHHTFQYVGYTAYWNAMDYPSCVIPVTKLNTATDTIPEGVLDHPLSKREMKFYKSYEFSKSNNGPVGLQVLTQRYQDEKALYLAKVLQNALKSLVKYK